VPFLNFALYLAACLAFWAVSLLIYVRATPYPEFALVRDGNLAAALSLTGAALGLALPIASLAAHAVSLADLAVWAALALAVQLAGWWILSRTVFRSLREAIVTGNHSVGLVLGAFSAGLGLLNAACLTY